MAGRLPFRFKVGADFPVKGIGQQAVFYQLYWIPERSLLLPVSHQGQRLVPVQVRVKGQFPCTQAVQVQLPEQGGIEKAATNQFFVLAGS